MCRIVGCIERGGNDDLSSSIVGEEGQEGGVCLLLGRDQREALHEHHQAVMSSVLSSDVASATQWANELFHLAAASCSESTATRSEPSEERVPLCPDLLSVPAAWTWLVEGAAPATVLSPVPSAAAAARGGRACWVGRSGQVSFGQLLAAAALREEEAAALRRGLHAGAEERAALGGEARALRSRLAELESLLRATASAGAAGAAGSGVQEGHGGQGDVVTLARENKVPCAHFSYHELPCAALVPHFAEIVFLRRFCARPLRCWRPGWRRRTWQAAVHMQLAVLTTREVWGRGRFWRFLGGAAVELAALTWPCRPALWAAWCAAVRRR